MVSSEDGAPTPLQQTDLQAGVSGHGEKGGTYTREGIHTGDEGDCGTYFAPFDRLRNLLTNRIGTQTQQDHLVLLAARDRECTGGGEGVL